MRTPLGLAIRKSIVHIYIIIKNYSTSVWPIYTYINTILWLKLSEFLSVFFTRSFYVYFLHVVGCVFISLSKSTRMLHWSYARCMWPRRQKQHASTCTQTKNKRNRRQKGDYSKIKRRWTCKQMFGKNSLHFFRPNKKKKSSILLSENLYFSRTHVHVTFERTCDVCVHASGCSIRIIIPWHIAPS